MCSEFGELDGFGDLEIGGKGFIEFKLCGLCVYVYVCV